MPSSPPAPARVANLLRLMHAVSHDLPNPLQALVLHATMGLEDAEPGSEQSERHQADVEATRRMRGLLRALQGFATAGDRPRTLASMLDRFVGIFADRYARLGAPLEVTLLEGAPEVSMVVEETLVAIGLALGTWIRHESGELETVRVIEKRPERVDPFAFRPLFDPDANRFQRYWNEPPSVEDVSMSGGYLMLGINRGLLMAADAVSGLRGWKQQVRPAAARPSPLDPGQAARAARLREAGNP